jgi:hypothetical protein
MDLKDFIKQYIKEYFKIISSEETLEDLEDIKPFFTDKELRRINQRLFTANEEINKKEIDK